MINNNQFRPELGHFCALSKSKFIYGLPKGPWLDFVLYKAVA